MTDARPSLCDCLRIHGMPLCTGGGCRNAEPVQRPSDPPPDGIDSYCRCEIMVTDLEEFLDGWALWQEHRPQSAEDWVEVAKRCAADPEFDYSKSSPVFGAAYLLARELAARAE